MMKLSLQTCLTIGVAASTFLESIQKKVVSLKLVLHSCPRSISYSYIMLRVALIVVNFSSCFTTTASEEAKCSKVTCLHPRRCRIKPNSREGVECVCPPVDECLRNLSISGRIPKSLLPPTSPNDQRRGSASSASSASTSLALASSPLRPVCGSDLVLYPTLCHLVSEACVRNVQVEVLQHDYCPYKGAVFFYPSLCVAEM